MSPQQPGTPRRPAHSSRSSASKPKARTVIMGSIALFAVLFALITLQLSSGTEATTSSETVARESESSLTSSQYEPVETDDGATEVEESFYEEPQVEETYVEPEFEEETYVEPQVEEAPQVRSGGS